MSRRNLIVLIGAILIAMLCFVRSEQNPHARSASLGYRLIEDRALYEPTDEQLLAGAMRGMVDVLRRRGDEHSAYIEPRRAKPLQEEMRQQFGGVGIRVELRGEPPRLTVAEPPRPGAPAYRAGVRSRDCVVAVDNESIVGLSLGTAVERMRGPVGEPVVLTVERPGQEEPLEFRLVREVIRLPSVIGDLPLEDGGWRYRLDSDPRVALLRVTTFGARTVEELGEALRTVTEDGAEAVVLDFRGNSGGAVDTAIGVAELFMGEGETIFSTRGRDGKTLETYRSSATGPFVDLSLAVLLDRDSASASELVAAALQDHRRAAVVGERSYGKGTVQQLLDIDGQGALLKLTYASFWRPSGEQIHRPLDQPVGEAGGVAPDAGLEVPLTQAERESYYEWRRARDLVPDGQPNEADGAKRSLGPLEADPVLAAAVRRVLADL